MLSNAADSPSSALLALPGRVAASYGWSPLVSLARSSVNSLFSRLQVGLLTIRDSDGTTYRFGDQSLVALAQQQTANLSSTASSSSAASSSHSSEGALNEAAPIKATLVVKDDTFWVRMFFGADLGFSEAFMAGEVETPDLGDCFSVSMP